MSVRIGAAVRAGVRRAVSRDGLVLAAGFVVIGLVAAVGTQSLLADLFRPVLETMRSQPTAETGVGPSTTRSFATVLDAATPLALDVPVSVGGALVVLAGLLAEALRIVAVRTFVADAGLGTDRFRPLVLPTINGVVGGLVVWFLTGLGGVLGILAVVVGGVVVALFLATSFLFVRQEVAVENRNFVGALNESWQVASGHRRRLLGLGVAVVALTLVPVSVVRVVFGVVFGPLAVSVVGVVGGGIAAVFGTGAITHAYSQLRAERRDPPDEPGRIY